VLCEVETDERILVILIGYNRLEKISERLQELRGITPKNLLVSIDYKSKSQSRAFENLLRETSLNWNSECNLEYQIQSENKGLALHITETITNSLTKYEAIILLEDDVSIGNGFLAYANSFLSDASFSENFSSVGGYSAIALPKCLEKFNLSRKSPYFLCWGWGTTREVWSKYKLNLHGINFEEELRNSNSWKSLTKAQQLTWLGRFSKIGENPLHTWDTQFQYLTFLLDKKQVRPIGRIVENMGFDDSRSSHTSMMRPIWMGEIRKSNIVPKRDFILPVFEIFASIYESVTTAGDHPNRVRKMKRVLGLFHS
jgi:hypothetical protein